MKFANPSAIRTQPVLLWHRNLFGFELCIQLLRSLVFLLTNTNGTGGGHFGKAGRLLLACLNVVKKKSNNQKRKRISHSPNLQLLLHSELLFCSATFLNGSRIVKGQNLDFIKGSKAFTQWPKSENYKNLKNNTTENMSQKKMNLKYCNIVLSLYMCGQD